MVVEIRDSGFHIDGMFFYPVGFNYWPRDAAVYLWKEYDPVAIQREFEIMENISINCLRVCMMWDDVSRKWGAINTGFLANFKHFHDTASAHGIKLTPTFFIGHMSGQDWFPEWFHVDQANTDRIPSQIIALPPRKKTKGAIRDIYIDEEVYKEAFMQLEAILPKYTDSNTILSWDLSNENQYMMLPKDPVDGYRYMKRMYEKMRELDPNHPVTIGMGKLSEKSGFHSFGKHGINHFNDYYSVHTYPIFYYPPTLKILDFYTTYKPAFDVAMAQVTELPIQEQEFGMSDMFFMFKRRSTRDALLGGYYSLALYGSLINGATCGVLAWCFTDFLPTMKHREPYNHKKYELTFGNVDVNYKLKASGRQVREFARFTRKYNLGEYVTPSSDACILFPEHYNAYADKRDKLEDLTDDSILKKIGRRKRHVDCLQNQNRAMFSAFVFSKMSNMTPAFSTFSQDLSKWKILLLPNLRQLSERNFKKLVDFVDAGGFVYISSNDFIPSQLTGNVKLKPRIKKIRRRQLRLNPDVEIDPSILAPFMKIGKFYTKNEAAHVIGIKITDALYFDANRGEAIVTFIPSRNDKGGGFFLMVTSPEINHTGVRNAYQDESMHLFYSALFEVAGLKRNVTCMSNFIETGQMHHDSGEHSLLFVLNHKMGKHNFLLTLDKPITSIQEVNSYPFSHDSRSIHVAMENYGTRVFK
ncbi:cellulase family glycosylhydrolase, partial [Candidatus Bathyarchaeota archaeon]|nr:cellulase family glycosylhydrolase [Candidatus Bathyarchaeota archaeon]